MQLVWSILGLIVIAYVWIWVFTNYFSQKLKKGIIIKAGIFSSLIAILLFVYHLLPSFFGDKIAMDAVSYRAFALFGLYCIGFILLLSIQMRNMKYSAIKKMLVIALLCFCVIGIGGISAGISSVLLYYFTAVYAEEILKFAVGENVSLDMGEEFPHLSSSVVKDKTPHPSPLLEGEGIKGENLSPANEVSEQGERGREGGGSSRQTSNLIFISILVGLGFSMVETVLYLVNSYILGTGNVLALSVSRGLFAGLLHLSATGLIAYFVAKNREKILSGFVLGICAGFGLHVVYNLSLYYHITLLTIGILIGCYFILSYLLFNSDIVYQEE